MGAKDQPQEAKRESLPNPNSNPNPNPNPTPNHNSSLSENQFLSWKRQKSPVAVLDRINVPNFKSKRVDLCSSLSWKSLGGCDRGPGLNPWLLSNVSLFPPFVLIHGLKDAVASASKAEVSRKRAEDIAAGTVQMNGRELFLHEPWDEDSELFHFD
ncbi:hypothetical protein LguiA_004190 [Lonicera macranthoides]